MQDDDEVKELKASADLKMLKKWFHWKLQTNVLEHLLLQHWQAILCPPLSESCKQTKPEDGGFLCNFNGYKQHNPKKYNRYAEPVSKLKLRVREVVQAVSAKADSDRQSAQNDRQRGGDLASGEPPKKRQRLSGLTTPMKKQSTTPRVLLPTRKKENRPVSSPDRQTAEREVDKYLIREFGHSQELESFDNPEFWLTQENQDLFPHLSLVALQILIIPASSAAVERLFSIAGQILSDKRLSTTTEHVGMLCVLNKNKHF